MTAIALAAAAARALGGRTASPVRRDSLEAGSFEARFFRVPERGETDRLVRAASRARDAGRQLARAERAGTRVLTAAEQALVALTAGALRVFEELCALARLNAGRVYPSYDRLAAVTGLGRATVARGIAALERAGFLVRQRRYRRVAGAGVGPEVRHVQTSNAYRPTMPRAAAALPPRTPPLPDDAAWHAETARREMEEMTPREPSPLARALASLGRRVAALACESHDETETRTQFNMNGTVRGASIEQATMEGRPPRQYRSFPYRHGIAYGPNRAIE